MFTRSVANSLTVLHGEAKLWIRRWSGRGASLTGSVTTHPLRPKLWIGPHRRLQSLRILLLQLQAAFTSGVELDREHMHGPRRPPPCIFRCANVRVHVLVNRSISRAHINILQNGI